MTVPLTSTDQKPLFALGSEKAFHAPLGAVSPLWLAFAGATGAGLAYWWMSRWMKPFNIEALAAIASPAESEPSPITSEPVPPEPVVLESAPAVVEAEPAAALVEPVVEPVVEAVIEATPEPAPEPESEPDVVAKAPESPPPTAKAAAAPAPVVKAAKSVDAASDGAAKPKKARAKTTPVRRG